MIPDKIAPSHQSVRFRLLSAGLVSLVGFAVLFGIVKYSLGYGQVRETIFNAVRAQWGLEDWGHCMMVPFAVALIVFLERSRLMKIPLAGSGSGLWILAADVLSIGSDSRRTTFTSLMLPPRSSWRGSSFGLADGAG